MLFSKPPKGGTLAAAGVAHRPMRGKTYRRQSSAFTRNTESFLVLIVVPQDFVPEPRGDPRSSEPTTCLSPYANDRLWLSVESEREGFAGVISGPGWRCTPQFLHSSRSPFAVQIFAVSGEPLRCVPALRLAASCPIRAARPTRTTCSSSTEGRPGGGPRKSALRF